jgi:hypothetical protein
MTFVLEHSLAPEPTEHVIGASRSTPVLTGGPPEVLRLQRLVGNRATARLLRRQLSGGQSGVNGRGLSSLLTPPRSVVQTAVGEGDSFEEADRVSDHIGRKSERPVYQLSPASHGLQRQGGRWIYEPVEDRVLEQAYVEFVTNAEACGLPVTFLADVSKTTPMVDSADYVYNATFNYLHLITAGVVAARNLAPTQKVLPTIEISQIYHESTHAYLYEHRDTQPIKQFYERGTQYYEGAPTAKHRITSDPERVFQEACAVYVGGRAAAWLLAFSQLTNLVARSQPPTRAEIEDIRSRYERVTSERIIGYSDEGGFFSNEQDETTRPISDEMKAFLDRVLLENRIPDSFDQVPAFRGLVAEATALANGVKMLKNRWK